jgi:hypothetical protein
MPVGVFESADESFCWLYNVVSYPLRLLVCAEVKKPADSGGPPPKFPALIFLPRWYFILTFVVFAVAVALLCTVLRESVLDPFVRILGRGDEDSVKFFLELASIPVVSIAFTYCHIWAALWMTFYPLKYVGCLQIPGTNTGLGWQGIIPNKAVKMAKKAVKLMTGLFCLSVCLFIALAWV